MSNNLSTLPALLSVVLSQKRAKGPQPKIRILAKFCFFLKILTIDPHFRVHFHKLPTIRFQIPHSKQVAIGGAHWSGELAISD
jgi:hypothetical protein